MIKKNFEALIERAMSKSTVAPQDFYLVPGSSDSEL